MNYIDIIHEFLGALIPMKASVALFDYPNHPNVGDSAIWLGEEVYLKTKTKNKFIRVDECSIDGELPPLPQDALVLIHGGGNFGDLWPRHQKFREQIIGHYRNNRIIQLPQSIHFQDKRGIERCRSVLNSHPDFHLLVRDHESLHLASLIYDGPTYLCPDMALCLGSLPRTTPAKHPVLGLLRTDKEKVKPVPSPSSHVDFLSTDWLDEPMTTMKWLSVRLKKLQSTFPRWTAVLDNAKPTLFHRLANERVRRGCDLLCSGEVIITDRLHGHLMCCLLEIPHVVLDNSYRKIGNFRDSWGTGGNLCMSASTLQDASEKAFVLLEQSRASSLNT